MTYSTRTTLIAIASFAALFFIVVAVLISGPLPFHLNAANAESTHELLVSYAAKDSDSDGLPDWEEALYGTDPNNPHSVNADVTDGQAVAQGLVKPKFSTATTTPVDASSIPGAAVGPQTVTDQFARTLFSDYLSSHGSTQPTPEEIATFVERKLSTLKADQQVATAFNVGQVRVAGTGSDALLAYAASVEQLYLRYQTNDTENEIEYLSDASTKSDPKALVRIAVIGKAYTSIGQGLMKLSVPKELATAHLQLANSMVRLGGLITDMSYLDADPFRAVLAFQQYQDASTAMYQALSYLNNSYSAEGVTINQNVPGSRFYATMVLGSSVVAKPQQ